METNNNNGNRDWNREDQNQRHAQGQSRTGENESRTGSSRQSDMQDNDRSMQSSRSENTGNERWEDSENSRRDMGNSQYGSGTSSEDEADRQARFSHEDDLDSGRDAERRSSPDRDM
ncbi:hypothetical protein HYN48_09530 [Flavobacterium magnum]|uniref:Uncharacterized protein n=1 Tax=Flavobacterium magnum TaxID=2162713 RepID=A0A2S0RFA0_9FLAO|nr:hypothetical protein [Flavobacterium magnum]AWA30305.1 hypothetical protein HYN48_09530 [Flavobacterium magnum]